MKRNLRNAVRGAGIAVALTLALWLFLLMGASGLGDSPVNVEAQWTRTLEPVILTGSDLPQFNGASLDDLFAYSYAGSAWTQIPFQVDEVDGNGVYQPEDGLLDGNDELVFMAMDVGEQADAAEWLGDADSQAHPRYEVAVVNPLNPVEKGWIYVYRSATLVPGFDDYVDWDVGNTRIVAETYSVGYAPSVHPNTDSLELNGSGIDVLDRGKLRIAATCWLGGNPFQVTVTEEDLAGQFDITPSIDGPVRVGGGLVEASSWSYASIYQANMLVDLDGMDTGPCDPLEIHSLRQSNDWLNPIDTGMAPAVYYDDNTPGGVSVDGSPDSIPATPANAWRQVSGGRGSLVHVLEISLGGGSVSNFYEDDDTWDPNDTGDLYSYGDAGFQVDNPSGQVLFQGTSFVLGPGQPNVGATFLSLHQNPLQATATEQVYQSACEPSNVTFDWLPRPPYLGVEAVFTASVGGGDPPFSYEWEFGDDGSIAASNPVAHTFSQAGTFDVTLTVSNACGQAVVVEQVQVVENCIPVSGTELEWTPAVPRVGQPVTFRGEAQGTLPIGFEWEFGDDGSVQTGQQVFHTFALTGTYPVTLTSSNPCISSQSVTAEVTVVEGGQFFCGLPLVLHGYAAPVPPPPGCYPKVTTTVDVGDTPHGVAVNSAANLIYVTDFQDDALSVVDGNTYAVLTTVTVGDGPNAVAYNATNDRIYVANRNADTVTVLKASDYSTVKTLQVGDAPNGLGVNEVTNRIYVANFGGYSVSVIDGTSNSVIATLPVGLEPSMIAVNPNTNKAYVSLHGFGQVAIIDGANNVTHVDVWSAGPYGITVDTQRNLVYVATIDTHRIAVVDGSSDTFAGWAEIRRLSDGAPVPLRLIGVNPDIGSSGHVFVTTIGEDGGWNRFLLLPKGWPEYFDRAIALDLNEGREGMAFDPATMRVFATSRTDDLVAVFQDGEPVCPYNFADEYEITVCVAGAEGTCQTVMVR